MEGWLKGVMEEADKEKALKQVAEASLKEKTLGLNVMERRTTIAEKALELAKQKAKVFQGKLGKTKLKLVETASLVSEASSLVACFQAPSISPSTWSSGMKASVNTTSLNSN